MDFGQSAESEVTVIAAACVAAQSSSLLPTTGCRRSHSEEVMQCKMTVFPYINAAATGNIRRQ